MIDESILCMIPLLTVGIRRRSGLTATVVLLASLTAFSGCSSLERIAPPALRSSADPMSEADGVVPASATVAGEVMDASRHVSAALTAYQSGDT